MMASALKTNSTRRFPWKWIVLAAAVVGLIVMGRTLPLDTWLRGFSAWVASFGTAGVFLFAAMYAMAAVLFVPGSVLTIGAGFIFGIFWGTLAVSIGSTLGAGLAFLVARYFARKKIASLAQKSERFAAVDEAIGSQGWKIVLLLRFSPLIPFNLSNYLYGLTAIPFWPYLLASWLGMLPGSVLYVYLGMAGRAGLEAAAGGQASTSDWLQKSFFLLGLLATLIVTWYVSQIARKTLQRMRLNKEIK